MLERADVDCAMLFVQNRSLSRRPYAMTIALFTVSLAFSLSLVFPGSARAVQPNNNFIELAHVDAYAQYNDC